VRAPPDGYTLLIIASSVAINATLYDNLNFNFIRDIAPVAGVFRGPYVMVVNPSVPTTTVSELIAYAKANPRKLNMASPGTGTGPHVPGYEASTWYGICAPKATPAEIVDKLNKEINAGLADPKMKARLADLGGDVLALSPADFGKLIVDETEKWGNVIRVLNIKAD